MNSPNKPTKEPQCPNCGYEWQISAGSCYRCGYGAAKYVEAQQPTKEQIISVICPHCAKIIDGKWLADVIANPNKYGSIERLK
jgi:hypothetical protein